MPRSGSFILGIKSKSQGLNGGGARSLRGHVVALGEKKTSGSRGFNQFIQVRLEITLRTLPLSNSLFVAHTSTGRCVIPDTGLIL